MKTLIRNANVLIDGETVRQDVLFDEEQILAIGSGLEAQADTIEEAEGLTLLPGLIDTHVHLREPGYEAKETIATGTAAAAHGGFTTIFAMPNVKPFPSEVTTVKEYLKKIKSDALVRVFPFATITVDERGKVPTPYKELKELGIRGFSDDGVGVADENVMRACMEAAKQEDVLFSCHTEDMNYRALGSCVHEGRLQEQTGWKGIPSACESAQLIRDLDLVRETGVRYHADHISAKESVEALKKAKEEGLPVTGEVTVHHLLLEDKDVKGPNWKMNPPLRSHADRMALIEGLENGSLDWIANDHAPHTKEEKARPMDKAPFGIVALETAFPLLYTEFVDRTGRWSLGQLVDYMSGAPARGFGLEKSGAIKEGYRPDLVLVKLGEESVIDKDSFLSKGKNTPFDGWTVTARIVKTYAGGRPVYTA